MKVSDCVDCGTAILGDRLRCPHCHDKHAKSIMAHAIKDIAPPSVMRILLGWMVSIQIVAIVVLMMILAAKECQ